MSLKLYNFGAKGVNVDKSPLHLEDNELTSAQNITQNKLGVAGGIVNRPGLTKYDSDVAAGSLLGAINAPLGPGPGLTTADTTTYYLSMNASPYWRTSTNSFSTTSTTTLLAQAGSNDIKCGAMLNGRLYYIAVTVADNQSIREFDGVQDRLFSVVPSGYTIGRIRALKGKLYAAVTNGTTASYVYQFDSAGRIRQVGAALPTAIGGTGGTLFEDLGYHHGDLYVAGRVSGVEGKVYRIHEPTALTTTAWTLDFTHPVVNGRIRSMTSFAGLFYIGRQGVGGTTGAVMQRSAAGVYSAIDDAALAAANPTSLLEWSGFVYAWWIRHNGTIDRIRRSSNGTSWSTVFSSANADEVGEFFRAGNKLFAIIRASTGTRAGYYSTNGTSWTSFDLSASDFSQHALGIFRL